MDDDILMQQVCRGDEAAFCTIVRYYGRTLYRFAARQLGDIYLAHDAVQETFVRLWRSRTSYRHCGKLSAYLYRLTRNICIDLRERNRPSVQLDDAVAEAAPAADELISASALSDAVRLALLTLPDEQRIVFSLSCDGLSYAEIAEIVECPVGTVASRKRLAVQALRAKLAGWED